LAFDPAAVVSASTYLCSPPAGIFRCPL